MTPKPTKKAPARSGGGAKPKTLVAQVEAAVKAAPWITAADQATVALAVKLARELEFEVDPRLGKLLVDVLSSLGLTVAGRGTKPQEPEREVSHLEELRKRSAARRHPTAAAGNP